MKRSIREAFIVFLTGRKRKAQPLLTRLFDVIARLFQVSFRPNSPLLIGELEITDIITEKKGKVT